MIGFLKLSARRLLHGALFPARVSGDVSRGFSRPAAVSEAPYREIHRDLHAALDALSSLDTKHTAG